MDTHGTVYIIDDDAQVLSSTTFLLEPLNYCVKKFQSPSKFLSIILAYTKQRNTLAHKVLVEFTW
jgi:FixJ family two-component response regulator